MFFLSHARDRHVLNNIEHYIFLINKLFSHFLLAIKFNRQSSPCTDILKAVKYISTFST